MKKLYTTKEEKRNKRQIRGRARISGTTEKPRLNVFRSLNETFVQLIDDESGKTLLSVHTKTMDASGVDAKDKNGKVKEAYQVGYVLGKMAQEKNISKIVFDRAGYAYHGRVKAVAEGAREAGLQF
jgi:large subunit ribosomal protein L18